MDHQHDELHGDADPRLVELMDRACSASARVIEAIPAAGFDAPSPCAGWTVRDVGDHLVGVLTLFAGIVEENGADSAAIADGGVAPEQLGSAPEAACRTASHRWMAAFRRPGVMENAFPFPPGPTPGHVIARIGLSELLFHSWDMASGAGVPFEPDEGVVAVVARFQARRSESELRADGMFGPTRPTAPDASPFAALLGFSGRKV